MSRGWESKSVAEQQAAAEAGKATSGVTHDAERQRRIQELELKRERVLSEQTSSPHRRNALQLALATIERDLQELGWMIKL